MEFLGLPDAVRACLFDLDGVLTRTAAVHSAAWKEMFDDFLRDHPGQRPFGDEDYERYVDGRPRLDGTRAFLESRGIELPDGEIERLSSRKNDLVMRKLDELGVEVFDGSIDYVRAARKAGLHTAVVSSSRNTPQVLAAAGITDLFDAVVDGRVAAEQGIPGKPAPDTFLAAAKVLAVRPDEAAVFEDAIAGVKAGAAGEFALVVGVDRAGQADELRRNGADVVVADLSELMEAG